MPPLRQTPLDTSLVRYAYVYIFKDDHGLPRSIPTDSSVSVLSHFYINPAWYDHILTNQRSLVSISIKRIRLRPVSASYLSAPKQYEQRFGVLPL